MTGRIALLSLTLFSPLSLASTPDGQALDFTHSTIGYAALLIFAIAYTLVMLEEYLQLRKSKAGLAGCWADLGHDWLCLPTNRLDRGSSSGLRTQFA